VNNFVLRYVIEYHGFKNTVGGFVLSLLLATGLIFIPHIPMVSKRWINLVNVGGWYDFEAPNFLPPRIWVASLMLMGGTLLISGLVWLLRREKSTVRSA
jgi:hypothetical protein